MVEGMDLLFVVTNFIPILSRANLSRAELISVCIHIVIAGETKVESPAMASVKRI
jgi:hypothetical protein